MRHREVKMVFYRLKTISKVGNGVEINIEGVGEEIKIIVPQVVTIG